jgi:heterodisulfide reductase subunit A-like polyferredoxin
MVAVAQHPNIELVTYAEVSKIPVNYREKQATKSAACLSPYWIAVYT